MLLGAIAGDIIGSRFEFKEWKNKEFDLFSPDCRFTDDTICTLALADAILKSNTNDDIKDIAIESLRRICIKHIDDGYGKNFTNWLKSENPQPYNSWGNGAAMRISAAGWARDTLRETIELADKLTEITHNHLEGIKAAEATAGAIYMARKGATKREIFEFISRNYSLDRLDYIRPTYHFHVSSQKTMPVALGAFFEGLNYEDCIRLGISMGGDADTIGAITGSIAGAFYGVPPYIWSTAFEYLTPDLQSIVLDFEERFNPVARVWAF